MNRMLRSVVFTLIAVLAGAPAQGQQDTDWEYLFAPFVWFAGIEGDITVRDRKVDVDIGFSDILDTLDIGFEGQFEARKDRIGLLIQANYFKMSTDEDASSQGPVGFERQLDLELEQTLWILEVGGYYTAAAWEPAGLIRRVSLDGLVGGRYLNMENELDAIFTGPLGTRDLNLVESIDWIDPFVGARVQLQISERLLLNFRGDVGGFGIGEASDFTWNVLALAGYRVASWATILGGYRALGWDYDDGSAFDLTMHGPMVGVAFTF